MIFEALEMEIKPRRTGNPALEPRSIAEHKQYEKSQTSFHPFNLSEMKI